MPAPVNRFKARLFSREPMLGFWLGMANGYTAEICARAMFDWLVVDAEHGPNDLSQLQAIAASEASPAVRPPIGDAWILKQLLDLGAQTILAPMVNNAEQACDLVRAIKYPPAGVRGGGAALARASDFNRIPDYLMTADAQTCLIAQVESVTALDRLESICAIDGVDGVFIGPADLAADMGYLGRPGEPAVQNQVKSAIRRILSAGKPAGTLTSDRRFALECMQLGATFVAVGSDVTTFSHGVSALRESYRNTTGAAPTVPAKGVVY